MKGSVGCKKGRAIYFRNRSGKLEVADGNVKLHYPTSPFAIKEPQNPWIDEFYVVQERRATDFEAPKL